MKPGGDNFWPEISSRSTANAGDGSSIEHSAKRRRGRPIGSKNKLKPPVIITCESEPVSGSTLCTHVLEISAGLDVAKSLSDFSLRRRLNLCVLAGSGPISTATILQTSPSSAALTFRGRFDLISLSATFLLVGGRERNMSVSFGGPQGQVVGGAVVGPLVAADKVMVLAAVFSDPVFHRLPEEEGDVSGSASGEEVSEGR